MDTKILTTLERNGQVKDYINAHFSEESPATSLARENIDAHDLKQIYIPENVGKMLSLLAKLQKPKRILEIGTQGGYSTLWLAGALEEEGKIVTIECEKAHWKVAEENFSNAGISHLIEIRKGKALDVLQTMIQEGEEPFDLIFLDADKDNYPNYLEPMLSLSRSGTLLLSDNLIPKRGKIGNPDPRDNEAVEIYVYNQMIANHPRLEPHLFPTIVGEKGRIDALGVAIVK